MISQFFAMILTISCASLAFFQIFMFFDTNIRKARINHDLLEFLYYFVCVGAAIESKILFNSDIAPYMSLFFLILITYGSSLSLLLRLFSKNILYFLLYFLTINGVMYTTFAIYYESYILTLYTVIFLIGVFTVLVYKQ